jgi:hypothetical protein
MKNTKMDCLAMEMIKSELIMLYGDKAIRGVITFVCSPLSAVSNSQAI